MPCNVMMISGALISLWISTPLELWHNFSLCLRLYIQDLQFFKTISNTTNFSNGHDEMTKLNGDGPTSQSHSGSFLIRYWLGITAYCNFGTYLNEEVLGFNLITQFQAFSSRRPLFTMQSSLGFQEWKSNYPITINHWPTANFKRICE